MSLDPDHDDGDDLDQPGLEPAAEVLGLPAEQLAAIVEDNRRLAAELAAMAEADADLAAELRVVLHPDELAEALGLARPHLDLLDVDQDGTRPEGARP